MKPTRPLIASGLLMLASVIGLLWLARNSEPATPGAQTTPASPAAADAGTATAAMPGQTSASSTLPAPAAPEEPLSGGVTVSPWRLTGKPSAAPARRGATGPAMEIDATVARGAWAGLKPGDVLDLDLGADGRVRGRVNLVASAASPAAANAGPAAAGATRIEGTLLEQERGSFSLRLKDAVLSGALLLPGKNQAYLVSAKAGGPGALQPVPLGSLLCHPLPRAPGASPPAGADRETPRLESKPGAEAVLFLNFDGAPGVFPHWNDGHPIAVQPSPLTAEDITYVWKSVSEDYRPFNVNITTMRERYEAAPAGRRTECIITPTDTAMPGAGGVAWLYSFYWDGDGRWDETCCWVFNPDRDSIAEAASHELGHTLGLSHDGTGNARPDTSVYYEGHADRSWGPIMGGAYRMDVVQWSKGEYTGANNPDEDDIAIIATGSGNAFIEPFGEVPDPGLLTGLGFAADGVGGGRDDATPVPLAPGGAFSQAGIILGDTDVNLHQLVLPGDASSAYTVAIQARPAATRPNVKLSLELQPADAARPAIATAGDPGSPDKTADIAPLLLESGTYYLQIRGIGYTGAGPDTASSGYTAYGSAGEYTLAGTVAAYTQPVELRQLSASTEGVLGREVILAVSVSAHPPAQLIWKLSPDGGETWLALADGGHPLGGTYALSADGARLTITDLTEAMTGYQYQCVATNIIDDAPRTASTTTTLNVVQPYILSPVSLARDNQGNLYVADDQLHVIQKITPGALSTATYAGETETPGLRNGLAPGVLFDTPGGLAIDSLRDLYIADTGNHQLRRITYGGGAVSTIAGATQPGALDGASSNARFTSPADVAVAPDGTLYVADTLNHTIRALSGGRVATVFGLAGTSGWADGDATTARLSHPAGITVAADGAVYVADTGNHVIRKITGGTLATIAGAPGDAGFADGDALALARFNHPQGLTVQSGTLYIADRDNSAIRAIFSSTAGAWAVATVAGAPEDPVRIDGPADEARFKWPRDIIAGADGNLYVADTGNAAIRKIEPRRQNQVTTLALKYQPPPPADPLPDPVTPPPSTNAPAGGTSTSGGGAPPAWLLLALATLAGLRAVRPRR